ncbi:MAG: NosD domain-containing protein [Promethearchaeota archaeon]
MKKMEKISIIATLLCFLILISLTEPMTPENLVGNIEGTDNEFDSKASGYWILNEIYINDTETGVGAKNWTWAASQDWCSGSGTWADPYIIENVTIDAEGTGSGILIANSIKYFIIRNCTTYNSQLSGNNAGIKLISTNNGTIRENYCNANEAGIYMLDSTNNTVNENILNENSYSGIYLDTGCDENYLFKNIATNNTWHGIAFRSSSNNYIFKNELSFNDDNGILLQTTSSYNEIYENLVKNNSGIGIRVVGTSGNNLMYKNYFINNSIHAEDTPGIFAENSWNNTKIGNYWDNYTGMDLDGNGIGESNYTYIITGTSGYDPTDHLPIYGNPLHDGSKIHIDGSTTSGSKSWIWASTRAWCSGSGSSSDPYVIEDVVIDGGSVGSCILIGNSTAPDEFFKIRNCRLINSGSASMDAGIKLVSVVDAATLIENNCSNNYYGISLYSSDNNDILENLLQENTYGICLNYSDSNLISENSFIANTEYAIVENSVGNIFINNYVIPPLTISNVTSTNPDGTYRLGETIEITVIFSDTVEVTGTPQLTLETGDTDAIVDYTSGDGTNVLSFNYTVELDHYSTDLDYISTTALSLNGGTIRGIVGNDADLTLPSPGAANSLGANKDIFVDAKTPTVTQVTSPDPNQIYGAGGTIDIEITFSEIVYVTGTPNITLETGSSDAVVDYSSGNETNTLTFTYTVAIGHESSDLDYITINPLKGTIRDPEGLNADLTLPAPGTPGSLGSNKNLIVDAVDPAAPISLSADPSSWTNIDDFDLTWTNPSDLSGIVGAYYKLDSAPTSDTDGTYVAGADIESISGISVLTDGTHTVYVWLRDAAGNIDYTNDATTVLYLETVDPGSPTGLTASPSSWTNTDSFDLSWTNPADTSGIVGAYYKLDAAPTFDTDGDYVAGGTSISGISVSTDGTHTVYVWLRDGAGNINYNNDAITQLYLDQEDPTNPIGLSADPSSWTNIDDFDLTWTNPSDLSGIVGAYYKLDFAPTSDTDGTYVAGADIESISGISVSTDGTHTIYVWLRDAVGNIDYNNYAIILLYLDSVDPGAPTGLMASPSSWTNTDSFDLSWTNPVDTSGIIGAYYKLDSAPTSDTDGTYVSGGISISGISVSTDGTHTVYVWLNDTAGNIDYNNYDTTLLYLDQENPAAPTGLSADPSSWTNIDDFDLTWTNPSDLSGIVGAYYKLDSAPTSDTDGTYVAGADIESIIGISVGSDGIHTVYIWLEDAVGNIDYSNYATTELYLDIVNPSVISLSSTNADGTYGIGAVIYITITFSEAVLITGLPQLILETGITDTIIYYTSGNETDTLTFTYTVASGHTSSDLAYFNETALSGIIKDVVGNDADLELPIPGASGSLSFNKDIIIDTTGPTITNVSATNADGTYGTGAVIYITIAFSEAVYVTGTPQLTLETGSIDAVVDYSSGSGLLVLTFTYTVASGHNSSDLEYISINALSLNGGTIRDAVLNDAELTLPTPGAPGSLSANKDIVIDTTVEPGPDLTMWIIIGGSAVGVAVIATVFILRRRRKGKSKYNY